MAAAAAAMHREAAERRYRSESSDYYPTSASADREVWPPTPGRPGARAGPPHHHGHYYDDHAGGPGGRLGHTLATPSQLDYYYYRPEAASLSARAVDYYGPGHRDGAQRHNHNYCSLDRDRASAHDPAGSGHTASGRHGSQGATQAASGTGSCRSNVPVSSHSLSSCHGSRHRDRHDSPSSTRSHRGHHHDSDDRCFEPESDSGSDSDHSGCQCSTAAQHHSGRPTRSRYYYESPTQARHHDLQTGGRTGSGTAAGPLRLPVPVGSTSSRSVPISRDDPRHKSRLGPYW